MNTDGMIARIKANTGASVPDSPRRIVSPVVDRQLVANSGAEAVIAPVVAQIFEAYAPMLAQRYQDDAGIARAREGVMMAFRANDALWEVALNDQVGLAEAILKGVRLGLDLDPALGHCFLIPRWNGRARKKQIDFQVGYKGAVYLARNAGAVTVFGEVVWDVDHLEVYRGTDPRIVHRPDYNRPRVNPVCAYAVAIMADGSVEFEVLTTEEIETARAVSSASEGDAWSKHWAEMAKKTALLRLLKRMPVRLGADVHGRDVFSAPAEPEPAAPSETAAPAPVEADPAQPFDPEDES